MDRLHSSRGHRRREKLVTDPRERAELLARCMIDRWYERAPRAQRGAVNLNNRKARRIAANVAKLPELVQKI